MTSSHWKVKTSKDDSICNAPKESSKNINTLKKLFENNLKFLNINNAFKSKGVKGHKVNNAFLEENEQPRSTYVHKNIEVHLNNDDSGSLERGSYLNCKIANCCCKTFFREYNNTPNFKYRHLSKTPLKERSSYFNQLNSTNQISSTEIVPNSDESAVEIKHMKDNDDSLKPIENKCSDSEFDRKNRFYEINYEFYKPNSYSTSRSKDSDSTNIYQTISHKISEKQIKLKLAVKDGKKKNRLKKLDGPMKINHVGDVSEEKTDFFSTHNKQSNENKSAYNTYGFVNFTATSLNEGGYINLNTKSQKPHSQKNGKVEFTKRLHAKHFQDMCKENKNTLNDLDVIFKNKDTEKLVNDESEKENIHSLNELLIISNKDTLREIENHKSEILNFKYKVPKTKNIAVREHAYPYTLKKPRLTVKSVKNRNMRNIKRKQKLLEKPLKRAQTYSGYDNFAYRRSITELKLPICSNVSMQNQSKRETEIEIPEYVSQNPTFKKYDLEVPVLQNNNQFHVENRITSYNWPVTSFYIEKNNCSIMSHDDSFVSKKKKQLGLCDLNSNPGKNQSSNFGYNKKSNLRRHCSLGYLQDGYYDNNFSKHRRSLDNVNKVSTICGIQNLPEVNNKIVKQRKFPNLDIHAHALFAAVEHGYVGKTKTILESSDVDINSLNSDGLSPLDVAVLSNNKPLVKLLVSYGAQEGRKFYSAEDVRNHLYHLLHEAERRVKELSSSLKLTIESDQSSLSSSSSNIPSITVGDSSQNKTYSIWERRAKGLKRMLIGFEQIRPPDLPSSVTIEVTSISSVMVHFVESEHEDSPVTTKFRVQWSTDTEFCTLSGHYEVSDTRQMKYQINNLRENQSYYVRVAAGNIKGFSAYKLSTPPFIVASSWQDVTQKETRYSTNLKDTLDDVFSNVVLTHPYLKSNIELYGQGGELAVSTRRKKTTIKQLFTAASKFQKHLRRGVYLSCLLYHEDKVLVTNEDFLPVIEVDETYPKKIHADFHWFFKVAFSWNDLKWLKSDMEKSQNSSAVFRIKLLQAAVHMQTALSIQELGKLYHKLIRDTEGTIVISVINYIHSPKSVSVLNLRWLPLNKLTKRTNIVNVAESNVADILMFSIPDQITYHQVSGIKLPRGLYLSYLKMRSSVDSLQVLVPSRTPNIPPHCKIRDNPHITAEEWEWLIKKENLRECLSNASHQQRLFIEQIAVTARRLFTYMEINDDNAANHRLYDAEVIEVNKDVSLIMIVPPVETACSMPGQRELLLQRSDLLPLTVQVFEIVHFGTYQLDLISTYSRLSCIIEMDIDLAQHSLRKAFSSIEVSTAKSKLAELENLHSQLNTSWKQGRWLLDVISFARDRVSHSPINVRNLLTVYPKRTLPSNEHCYLLPPDPKTAKSRGSWPGIGMNRNIGRVPNEISRSEQHLTSDSIPTTQSSTKLVTKQTSPPELRTGSDSLLLCQNENILIRLDNEQQKYNQSIHSSGSLHSISSDDLSTSKVNDIEVHKNEAGIILPVPTSFILQVNSAYNIGLNTQVQFKFHVNPKTTAREIVELFIKQSALLKGQNNTVYSDEETANFCLVAVIGARERCLRDDFKLVQLQQPWKNGRLYVRRKSNVLAAIEYDSKQSSYV